MIKAVIIGASGHLEYLRPWPDGVSFAAVAPDADDEDINRIYKYFPKQQPEQFRSYRKMIHNVQPQVAVVNPRFHRTAEVLSFCLEQGIDCFVEKPIALDAAMLNKVRASQNKSGARIFPMMIHRYERGYHQAYEYLQRHHEQPIQVFAQKSYKMGQKAQWMHDKKLFGGLIPWVGTHAFDLIYRMMGMPQWVMATGSTEGNRHQGEIESSVSCLFAYPEGRQAVAVLNYLRPDSAESHGDDILRIATAGDVLEIRNAQLVFASGQDPETDYPDLPIFEDFMRTISKGVKARISSGDALDVCHMALAAERSLQSGEKVLL